MEISCGGSSVGGVGGAAVAAEDGAGGGRVEGNVQREEQEWPRGFLPVEKGTAFVAQQQYDDEYKQVRVFFFFFRLSQVFGLTL